MIKVTDNSKDGIYSSNMELIDNFTDYSSKNLDFDKPVEVEFLDDEENAKNPLGTTAHYNPDEMKITIYVTGRHLKDILRSISHELIHHVQNCRGDLDHGINKLGYAQDDKHMRGMEHEAYTMGNIMNFRDFEDNYKTTGANKMSEQKINKLRALVREGVKQVISEISIVGVPSEIRKKAMASPEYAGRYLATQNNSGYVNEDEGLVVQKSVQKWLRAAQTDRNVAKRFFDAYRKAGGANLSFMASFSPFSDVNQNFVNKQLAIMQQYAKSVDSAADGTQAAAKQQAGKATPDSSGGAGGRQLEPGQSMVPSSDKKKSRYRKPRYRKCDNPPFSKGCSGQVVKNVQALLFKALGGNLKRLEEQRVQKTPEQRFADGKFWSGTKRAVEEFQRRTSLPVTGIIDEKTLEAIKYIAAQPRPTKPAAGATAAGPAKPATPSSGLDENLLFKIRTIADGEVGRAISRSAALRSVEAKNINKIRDKYREQIVKNVAQQFIDKKLKRATEIQGAVKELVFALAQQMDKEAANYPSPAANVKKGIETNFDEFTKTLNEHKNNKLDDRFKKLVKAFKK